MIGKTPHQTRPPEQAPPQKQPGEGDQSLMVLALVRGDDRTLVPGREFQIDLVMQFPDEGQDVETFQAFLEFDPHAIEVEHVSAGPWSIRMMGGAPVNGRFAIAYGRDPGVWGTPEEHFHACRKVMASVHCKVLNDVGSMVGMKILPVSANGAKTSAGLTGGQRVPFAHLGDIVIPLGG